MATKPTCKVVLREKQGTDKGGARIYPKGCKVRTEIKPGNQVIKKDKAVVALILSQPAENPAKAHKDKSRSTYIHPTNGMIIPT